MSRIQIALALVASTLVALAAVTLAAGGDEPTPRDGGDAASAAAPEPETIRPCKTAVYGELGRGWRKRAVVAGPLALLPTPDQRPKHFVPDAELKMIVVVRAGARVTLAVPEAERQRISLLYDYDFARTSSVRFRACSRSGAEYPGPGGYPGRETQFNGGFFVRDAHCAAIEVWTEGRTTPIRRWLPFGVGERRCPPRRA